MDGKKISFGFSKVAKKPNLLANNKQTSKEEPKVELIKCLEGQEIKLVEEKKEAAPLIIPLKENQKTAAAIASLIKRRQVLLGEEPEEPPPLNEQDKQPNNDAAHTNGNTNESLEQRAARELLSELKANGEEQDDSTTIVPVIKADDLPLDGAKESTIDDYEDIPVQQFGMAMLRGMGWVEPPKKKGDRPLDETLFVRPKGMGLGADKALKAKPLLVPPESNEVLEIKKQAYVRILGGKHKDQYGQIEGFDDHAGRVIVKMAIGGAKEAFNEFLCQPVSRKEFAQYGKCINTAKYNEYKKMENEHGQIILKKEESDKKPHQLKVERKTETEMKRENNKRDSYRTNDEGTSRSNRDRDESYQRHRYDDDDKRSTSSRRYRDEERQSSSHSSRDRKDQRAPTSIKYKAHSDSSDDTSESSGTDSDSDSAYERKHKKSSNRPKAKKSSKKSKRKSSKSSKHQRHKARTSSSSSESSDSSEDERSRSKHHKKKTKKSKKPRSRTRSSSRTKSSSSRR